MTARKIVISQEVNVAARATRSLLDTLLDRNGLTFHSWVTLRTTITHAPATREEIIREAAAPGIDDSVVRSALDKIEADGLIGQDGAGWASTEQGREVFQQVTEGTATIAAQLYDGIPEEELVTAKRVLDQVTERASKIRAGL